MSSITTDTRFESFKQLNLFSNRMYRLIINALSIANPEEGMTAREIAEHLYNQELVRSNERGQVHPRITELVDKGAVKAIGKKHDCITDRNVAAYVLANVE